MASAKRTTRPAGVLINGGGLPVGVMSGAVVADRFDVAVSMAAVAR